jgi:hypothetical protein
LYRFRDIHCERVRPVVFKLLAFCDLRERKIARSWQQLGRLIKKENFPPGKMLGPNSRRWTEDEVTSWYEQRPDPAPVSDKPLRGGAKLVKEGKLNPHRKAQEKAALAAQEALAAAGKKQRGRT